MAGRRALRPGSIDPNDWDVLDVDACWSTPRRPTLIVATQPLPDCGYEVPAEAPEFAVLQPLGDRRPVVSGWRLGPLVLSVSTSESSTGVMTRSALATPGDESFRLTMFGTDRGFDDTSGVMMSLRIADAPMCIPDVCQPTASEPGSVRFEVVRQQGRFISVSAANLTDEQFTGGAQWNLQRWNGDSWQRMDVAGDVWTLIGLILAPQDRTTGAPGRGVDIESELPPVAGWYRIAKTMSGAGVGVEILSPPIPVQAAAG